ncbi:hypothetical protein, partial [Methylogaea oryzae]
TPFRGGRDAPGISPANKAPRGKTPAMVAPISPAKAGGISRDFFRPARAIAARFHYWGCVD